MYTYATQEAVNNTECTYVYIYSKYILELKKSGVNKQKQKMYWYVYVS